MGDATHQYATSTLRKYARSASLERDIEGDGAAIYFHNDNLMHTCDYACNGRRGERIAQQINELEERLGYKLMREEDAAEMERRFVEGSTQVLEKRLLDGFLIHYLSCTKGCESERTLLEGAREAHLNDDQLYELALARVGNYMAQNGIEIKRPVPIPDDVINRQPAARRGKR